MHQWDSPYQQASERKNYMTILTAEKASDEVQHPFGIKPLRKLVREFSQLDKEHLKQNENK